MNFCFLPHTKGAESFAAVELLFWANDVCTVKIPTDGKLILGDYSQVARHVNMEPLDDDPNSDDDDLAAE